MIDSLEFRTFVNKRASTFRIATGSSDVEENVMVKVVSGDLFGVGSGNPTDVTHETRDSMEAFLAKAQKKLVGTEEDDPDKLHARLDAIADGNTAAKAAVDIAVFDLLSKRDGKPLYEFLGGNRKKILTDMTIGIESKEVTVQKALRHYKAGFRALKIKVGGLMFMTTDMYASGPPGRTEKIIPLVRKTFGDAMALYADANGFYTVPEAIRVGRLLEEYKYRYFEEPVMFDHLEEIKQVHDALQIPIANGEQDYSFYGFRWLLANDGLDIVQPDNYYFGGLIRSMKVARMAAAFGKTIVPHMSGGGLGYLYNIHFVSAVPNAGEHHEFKGLDTHVRFECKTSPLKVVKGKIKVPTGPGFGVDFDPDWVKKHQPVKL